MHANTNPESVLFRAAAAGSRASDGMGLGADMAVPIIHTAQTINLRQTISDFAIGIECSEYDACMLI